jgi:hypothetical protein
LSVIGPYLVGECIDRIHFDILLLNFSKETIEHDPLVVARQVGDLDVTILQPDPNPLPRLGRPWPRDPFTQQVRLRAGKFTSDGFRFADFGYHRLVKPGRHRLDASLLIGGKKVEAPPVEFEVVELPPGAVLVSHPVPLEGREAARPADEQSRPFVQQVKVGNRTLLIYRRDTGPKWGGGIDGTFRLAELPGEAEMTVAGAYGGGKPLTITYQDAKSRTGTTTLVINSINGMPWDGDRGPPDPDDGSDRVIPPPRPIKP